VANEVIFKSINNRDYSKLSMEINGQRLRTNFKNTKLTDDPDFNVQQALQSAVTLSFLAGQSKIDCRDAMSMFGLMSAAYDLGRRGDVLEIKEEFTVDRS
jgi:hypothetical protein